MGGRIQQVVLTVTTTGVAGSATGSAVSDYLEGFILDIDLNFHASAPATTDTTIKQTGAVGDIVVVTNSATDARIAPRQSLVTAAAAAITDGHDRIPISGTITASLAGCDALTAALVATVRVQTL